MSDFFLFRVMPRGVSLVALGLCSGREGGLDVGGICVGRQGVMPPCGWMFCLVDVAGMAGLRSLWVGRFFLAREGDRGEKNVFIFSFSVSATVLCVPLEGALCFLGVGLEGLSEERGLEDAEGLVLVRGNSDWLPHLLSLSFFP